MSMIWMHKTSVSLQHHLKNNIQVFKRNNNNLLPALKLITNWQRQIGLYRCSRFFYLSFEATLIRVKRCTKYAYKSFIFNRITSDLVTLSKPIKMGTKNNNENFRKWFGLLEWNPCSYILFKYQWHLLKFNDIYKMWVMSQF